MILISGGTGFAGSAAVRELARRGERVAVLGRDAAKIARRFPGLDVEARAGDVRDAESLRAAFAGISAVVNAVQFPNGPIENKRKGWTYEQIDCQGTVNQVSAAKEAGVGRFVYVSGAGAAADAEKHWFRYKWQAEEAVRQSGIPHTNVRFTWMYGPEDVALNRFLGFARTLRFVPMFGDGKQMMQPIFIDDVGRILADAVQRDEAIGQTLEAGGPETMPMNDVLSTAMDVAELRRPVLHQPAVIGKMMGSLLQLLPNPPLSADAIDFITGPAVADNAALERTLSPRLTPLREGLSTYLRKE